MYLISIKLTILVLFSVLCLDAVKFRCDYIYKDIGWFKYHKIPLSWRDARLQCKLEGAMLASPTTLTIRNTMKGKIEKIDIFTGIHATFSKGQYYSIDGKPLSLIPHVWANSEPDNKNDAERCIALNSDGKISDVKCEEPRPYICFRANTSKDVNVCGTPDPEYRYDVRTNKCYKFHTNPRQFHRAFLACSAEGGHLAIINSEEEAKVIKELFAQYPDGTMIGNFNKGVAFIGFHNWDESMDWTTIHGQSLQEAGFDKFSDGQPDNHTTGEYCGSVFRNGLLNDLGCEDHSPFICEKNPTFPPVCDNTEEEFILDIRGTDEK